LADAFLAPERDNVKTLRLDRKSTAKKYFIEASAEMMMEYLTAQNPEENLLQIFAGGKRDSTN
jgi:hypothetical protein